MLNTQLKLSVAISAILISQAALAATPTAKGMTLWLDASDATTLFTDKTCTGAQAIAGGDVSCWKDKSNQKNDVIVADNVSPPKLLDKALNSKAVVDFNQTALVTKDKDQIKTNSSYTKVVVFKLDNDGGSNNSADGLSRHNLIGSDPYQTTLWADNGMLHSQHALSKRNYLDSTKKLGIKKYHIAVTRYSKPDYDAAKNVNPANILKLDGMREATNYDKADHTAARTSIGGVGKNGTGENYFYLDGQIAEAMIYNRSLTTSEIATIEQYLAKKWKLNLGQNIIFKKPKNQVKGNPAIQLHATSSAGMEVVFTSKTKGICKITSPGYVSLEAIGTCKIEANAAASKDGTYPKAEPVVQSFEIKAVKDNTTEPANPNPPSTGGSKGGGSPLPLGLALLGLLALIRRKLALN